MKHRKYKSEEKKFGLTFNTDQKIKESLKSHENNVVSNLVLLSDVQNDTAFVPTLVHDQAVDLYHEVENGIIRKDNGIASHRSRNIIRLNNDTCAVDRWCIFI